jgi:hypothetical protein
MQEGTELSWLFQVLLRGGDAGHKERGIAEYFSLKTEYRISSKE